MYSYEDRIKAVELYIQYNQSAATVIRELGYPDRHVLKSWYQEYCGTGRLHKTSVRAGKYSEEQREAAIQYYFEHGKNKAKTIKALGYPSRSRLSEWIQQQYPNEVQHCTYTSSLVQLSEEQKKQAAIELCTRDVSAQAVANKYKVSRFSVYNWAWDLLGKGNVSPMPKKKKEINPTAPENIESLKQEVKQLRDEAEKLQRQVYRLRLEKEVLEKAAEIIKKDEGVSLEKLTNHEKAIVIGALRKKK